MKAREVILAADAVFVSAVSVLEVALKRLRHRDSLPLSAAATLELLTDATYTLLSVSPQHAAAVEELPPIHRDPFDRLIAAQAIQEPLRLVTHDKLLARYSDSFFLV